MRERERVSNGDRANGQYTHTAQAVICHANGRSASSCHCCEAQRADEDAEEEASIGQHCSSIGKREGSCSNPKHLLEEKNGERTPGCLSLSLTVGLTHIISYHQTRGRGKEGESHTWRAEVPPTGGRGRGCGRPRDPRSRGGRLFGSVR